MTLWMRRLLAVSAMIVAFVGLRLLGHWGFLHTPAAQFSFRYLLPVVLVLMPLMTAVLTRTNCLQGALGVRQLQRIAVLRLRLFVLTALALPLILTLAFYGEKAWVLAVCFVLAGNLFAVPLIAAKRDFRPERQALLQTRLPKDFLPRWAWPAAWLFWGASALIAVVASTLQAHSLFREDMIFGLGISAVALGVGPFLARWWLQRPEPGSLSDPGAVRRAKAWGAYLISLSIALPFSLFAIADATGWLPEILFVMLGMFAPGVVVGGVVASAMLRAASSNERMAR